MGQTQTRVSSSLEVGVGPGTIAASSSILVVSTVHQLLLTVVSRCSCQLLETNLNNTNSYHGSNITRFDEQTSSPWTSVIGQEVYQEYHLNFDGSNDYVVLPDMSYLNDLTVSGWIKIHSRNTWERFFDFGKGGAGDMFLTVMGGRTNGNLEMTIHPNGGTYTINAGTTLQDGNWHNVVYLSLIHI